MNQNLVYANTGEKIFKENCSSCHINGLNKLAPSKPIIGSPILNNFNTFAEQLKYGVGVMPAFPNIANNKEDLKALYDYCIKLK